MKNHISIFGLFLLGLLVLVAAIPRAYANADASTPISIIITSDSVENARMAVDNAGGSITHELGIINAVGAIVTEAQITLLSADPRVKTVHNNEPVIAAGAIQTAQDNFSQISYANNDGTTAWLTDWEESNDRGKAKRGKVRIKRGALTLADNDRSIQRAIALTNASNVTLSFDYGLWRFDNANDYVVLEVNAGDGWVTLDRYAGPKHDRSRQNISYDLSPYASENTQIRFTTSSNLGRRDIMSIDNLSIEYMAETLIVEGMQNYADYFSSVSYSSNNGSLAWSSPWVETNDRRDAYKGHVYISSGNLVLRQDNVSVRRIADLSKASSATLDLNAKRYQLETPDEFVVLEVSADYGQTWHELTRFTGPANDENYIPHGFNLDAFVGSEIMIQFRSSEAFGDDRDDDDNDDDDDDDDDNNCILCLRRDNDHESDRLYIDSLEINFMVDEIADGDSSDVHEETVPASQMVNANELHDKGITGEGITVAIIDSGFVDSAALTKKANGAGRVLTQYDAGQGLVISTGPDSVIVSDDQNGHGTHIASIIANSGLDSEGRSLGVAPDVNLAIYKAFSADGRGSYADVIRALDQIISQKDELNIRIINMSFYSTPQSHYWEDPLNQAVMRAWEAGIVVVTGSGNTGPDALTVGAPGNIPYVITVGAYTDNFTPSDPSDDYIPPFSSAGPTYDGFVKPEILAPGAHILGLLDTDSQILQNNPNLQKVGDLYSLSGTSMSSAVTSGVIALMLQTDPNLTPDDVKCRLMDSANTLVNADDNSLAFSVFQQGTGLINAQTAIESTAVGCANSGLNISADLDGTEHYIGTVSRNAADEFVIVDSDGQETLAWDGTYVNTSANYAWTGANYAWTGANYAWTGGNYAWTGANYAWTGSNYAWTGSNYAWTGANYAWTGGNYAWTGAALDLASSVSNISYIIQP
ncbi:MAG: S8 family serine peptidase [Candidatus Promineifilaceae bacterium]